MVKTGDTGHTVIERHFKKAFSAGGNGLCQLNTLNILSFLLPPLYICLRTDGVALSSLDYFHFNIDEVNYNTLSTFTKSREMANDTVRS